MYIRKPLRLLAILAVAAGLSLVGTPAFAAPGGGSYTCSGGEIPSGTYSSITVNGPCSVGSGATIMVKGSVTVNSGAMLDAQSAPSTLTVGNHVTAGSGSFLGLGCQPMSMTGNSAHPCLTDPEGYSTVSVGGHITANDAATVMINGVSVEGHISLQGGGGVIPWSVKNNDVRGNVTVTGQAGEWVGVLFNHIDGHLMVTNIALSDPHPDAGGVYVVRNEVGKNLTCTGLTNLGTPIVAAYGNQVARKTVGQCVA